MTSSTIDKKLEMYKKTSKNEFEIFKNLKNKFKNYSYSRIFLLMVDELNMNTKAG